jgi:hypothetical protein
MSKNYMGVGASLICITRKEKVQPQKFFKKILRFNKKASLIIDWLYTQIN